MSGVRQVDGRSLRLSWEQSLGFPGIAGTGGLNDKSEVSFHRFTLDPERCSQLSVPEAIDPAKMNGSHAIRLQFVHQSIAGGGELDLAPRKIQYCHHGDFAGVRCLLEVRSADRDRSDHFEANHWHSGVSRLNPGARS